jgi:hypothetical protein
MTRSPTRLAVCVIAALLTACSSARYSSDWDQTADFSRYRTFAWFDHAGADRQPQRPDPILDGRIRRAIAQALLDKGLEQTSPQSADLLVTYYTSIRQEVRMYTTGYGYGYWGGWGMSTTQPYVYEEGTMIIDLVDSARGQLVWRGTLTKALGSGPPSDETVQKAVRKVLVDFPPTS